MPVVFLGYFFFLPNWLGGGGTFRPRHYQTAHNTSVRLQSIFHSLMSLLCVCVYIGGWDAWKGSKTCWWDILASVCVLISSQRPFLVCVCVFIERGAPKHTKIWMVEGFFFFLYFTRGNKTQHIFPTWGCFRSAGCGERENILCLPFLFFFVFYSIYLFQFFQLVTRQVVVNPLARWCCLTSARNSLSKCVRRRKRGRLWEG
jgi:hypothetical protein